LTGDSQSVLRGTQGNLYQCRGDPWLHFCTGYLEVYLFLN